MATLIDLSLSGDLTSTHPIYPGYNNGGVGAQTSYYLYGNASNSGIRTNGAFLVNGNIYWGTYGVWLSDWVNQNVRTDSSPTFVDVYATNWLRTYSTNGLYNQTYSTYFYASSGTQWNIATGSNIYLALRTGHEGTVRGYVHANTSNEIGFLTNDGNWGLLVDSSKNVRVYGVALTIGNTTSSDIYMVDTDEGNRRIHCNSGRIGFLSSSNTWGSWAANDGSWYSDQSMRAPIFYDSNDTNYYGDFASTSRFKRLLVQQPDSNNAGGPALRVSKGWDNGTPDISYDTVVIESNDVTSIRMKEADGGTAGWSTGDGYTSFTANTPMRFYTAGSTSSQVYSGMGGTLAMYIDQSQRIGMGTAAPTARLHIKESSSGTDVLAIDGVNGRLFTVTDDLSDSLFSVNTIAGLPVMEVFADNTVKIGKFGSNNITIQNGNIGINTDTPDANFPFYVGDRSTAASRYILANPGMGFNLAENYAQLQLYGPSGAYLDFVTSATDSSGRIMWNGNFIISGNTYFNNTLYTYTLYDRNDGAYYLDMNGTSRLGTVNANELRSYGNTYLGDGSGDETHINDIVRIGATDSGDAHLFFGEGGAAGSDYGAHWYWDSGYTFTWNTRNAGSDTALFTYVVSLVT